MTLTLKREAKLEQLLSEESTYLTISLPMERNNAEINRISLKNALRDAKLALGASDDQSVPSEKLLGALEEIATHEAFLNPSYPGLALLASLKEPTELVLYPLWQSPQPSVHLGERPFLAPFLRNRSAQQILVLHLADNGLNLLRGHFGELLEIPNPEELPENFDEVIQYEKHAGLDGNESFRNRSKAPGAGTIHGEGDKGKLELEFHRRYFRAIGLALKAHILKGEAILLAGVEDRIAAFRLENKDLPLLEVEIHGNFEERLEELKQQARSLLQKQEKEIVRDRLRKACEGSPETFSKDQERIAAALAEGRVAALFLNGLHEDLGDREDLAFQALRQGAEIYIVEQEDWEEEVLATLRW